MHKGIILNRIALAVCIWVVLLAMVPIAGCAPTPEAPPVYLLQWGSYGSGNGQFMHPYNVAIDVSGNVYVADVNNYRIQKFSGTGVYLTQWGSQGSGPGQFLTPYGLAVDTTGNVYVAEENNWRIQKFSGTGVYLSQWGGQGSGNGKFGLWGPGGIDADAAGTVYVTDASNNRIERFFGGNGAYLTQWGSSGTGNGQFEDPRDVAVDTAGNVYVADTDNNRIQKFTGTGAYLTQWGSSGSGNGQFNLPDRVAVDSTGNVYVVDTKNHRIQKFTGTGVYLTQWGSYGSGNGQFNLPDGVAVDAAGDIYVADTFNHRIQKFGKQVPGVGEATLNPNLKPEIVPIGTINVNAMLDGSPWTGTVSFTLTGPSPISDSSVPQTYDTSSPGNYTIAYTSGGPSGASLAAITSSPTQALTDGGTTVFTLNFRTNKVDTGTINIAATLDGAAWVGAVNFTITGPSPISGSSVPMASPNMPVGNYTLVSGMGGPSVASFTGVTPSATQILAAGDTKTFTLNFTTQTMGWCCIPLTTNYGSVQPATQAQCAQAGGTWYATQLQAVTVCQPPTLGWCCKDGIISQSTQADCAKNGGTWYATQAQATEACRPPLGWCCKDGIISQSTQADCARNGGTWYATQAQAIEGCKRVLPKK